jgi:osmoprotectant transport system substrate-binding protein
MRHRVRLLGGAMLAAGLGLMLVILTHGAAQGRATTTRPQAARTATVGSTSVATTTAPATTTRTPKQDLPGYGKPPVLLGDNNTPEQFVLGQLYALALQRLDYRVVLSRNIGPPPVTQGALAQGSLDIYPEYLNVWDGQIVGLKHQPRTVAKAFASGERYARAHKLLLLPPTPFSDIAGIAVSSEYASGNHLRKIGNLEPYDDYMTFGAPLPFLQGPDGLHALEHAYHFKPKITQQIDVGSSYRDLSSGVVQAAYASSTDPQLADTNFRLLANPKHVLGVGNVVPVVSEKTLKVEGPAFAATIQRVDALLTTSAMRGLNAEVELLHQSPTTVARTFLQGNGILRPPSWSKTGVLPPPSGSQTGTSVSVTRTGGGETTG